MLKVKKLSAFVLAAVLVLSLFTFGAAAKETPPTSMPTVLPDGTAVDIKSAIHFEDDETAWIVNDPDGTYDTMAATYGNTEEGAVAGKAFEMTTGGTAGSAQAILVYGPDQSVSIEGAEGVMFYADMSGLHSSTNGYVGISVALFPSTTPDGMYSMYLSTQGGGYSYTLGSSDGYYFDAAADKWQTTENSVSGSCMAVPEKFKGWIYIPFDSYFVNGTTTGKKNNMVRNGIEKGEFYMRALSIYTGGYDASEAGTRVLIDEVSFVGAGKAHQHKYGEAVTVEATCGKAGSVTKTCSTCGYVNVKELPKTAHTWGDWMYDAVNNVKVRVCSVCGQTECEDATAADASLPNYSDEENNTVSVVFDFNNGSKKVYHMAVGDTIDMGEVEYPTSYTEGNDKYLFNCWATDKEGLHTFNPHGATVTGSTTYYLRWALDTGYYYTPSYKIESSEGGVYNAPLYNKGKVIFYGSSNFRMWTTLISDMGPELPSLNHGISGCNDTHLIANLTRLVLCFEPKIVVINCSTNDLITTMTDDEIKANKELLYNTIHETYPETVILFTSHMPLPQYKGTPNEDRMRELNVWVKDFCDTHECCEYLDVFTDVIDLPSEYFKDALHFSEIGQELYGKMIKDSLLNIVDTYGIDFSAAPADDQPIIDEPAGNMANFARVKDYKKGIFTDVNEEWFASSVEYVYELGLMDGVGNSQFDPKGNLTVAQAVTMAARLNKIYTEGNSEFEASTAEWYMPYIRYAMDKGMIADGDFDSYTRTATRAEMAYIFANALPAAELEAINDVTALPDVTADTKYAEAIFGLYNAGILTGSDEIGTFNPDANITRAEAAAIISRMAVAELRKTVNF